jgi:hypothetical protein
MEFIFEQLQSAVNTLAQNEVVVWVAAFGIITLYFIFNLFFTPYAKYKRILKRDVKYLKQCVNAHAPVNVNKIVLPAALSQGYENYVKSSGRFPSELMTFSRKHFCNFGVSLALLSLALCFAMLSASVNYGFAPFAIAFWFVVVQGIINTTRISKHKKAKKVTETFTRYLDKTLGQSRVTRDQVFSGDVCKDKEVDEVISKINFLKSNGINENTAKEVAALLSNERMDKIRTHDQQKRLNLALNGLLQVMSKKQERQQAN